MALGYRANTSAANKDGPSSKKHHPTASLKDDREQSTKPATSQIGDMLRELHDLMKQVTVSCTHDCLWSFILRASM